MKDRVSQMSGDAPGNEGRNSTSNHPANSTSPQIVEQKLRQLGSFTGHIPTLSEVPYAFPLLVPCCPGEDIVVGPLPFRGFLYLFERRRIQHHLARLRVLCGPLVQMKASVCEVHLARQ